MPYCQTPITHTRYALVAFDGTGAERNNDSDGLGGLMSAQLIAALRKDAPTDVFLFSHGWQGDVGAAKSQYDRWIDAMAGLAADVSRMGPSFRPLWAGLHWPSLPWGDEELGGGGAFSVTDAPAPQALLETYLDRLGLTGSARARELMGRVFEENRVNAGAASLAPAVADAYNELAGILGYQSEGAGKDPAADNAPFEAQAAFDAMNSAGVSFGSGFIGGILGPLRQLSFWMMKKRARAVGEGGMHALVAKLMEAAPNARVHLMGHSFGCIVMSSVCNGSKDAPPLPHPIDSLALIQGAVSLWAFADAIPSTGGQGYFNSMVHRPAVQGPIVTTRSVHDTAVGTWYPAAVSLVRQDPSFDVVNPALVKWGAIGAFGIQGYADAIDQPMQPETADYRFAPGKVYNLEASRFIKTMNGAQGAHSDIAGPEVAHAIWQAAMATGAGMAVAAGAGAGAFVAAAEAPAPQAAAPVAAPRTVMPKQDPMSDTEMPLTFGVEAATGNYLPSIQPSDLDHIGADSQLVKVRAANAAAPHLAPIVDVDAANLATAGWAVLFAADADPARKKAIQEALQPLLDLRSSQAGELFHIFDKDTGYRANMRAEQWLTDRGSGFFAVDPQQGVPYYVMIAASPDEIPFDFQYELDMFFAVGRLHFDKPEEYGAYAANIVAYETQAPRHKKTIALFNTRNDGDRATALLHDQIAVPLSEGVGKSMKPLGQAQGFTSAARLADAATKAELLNILRGKTEAGAPALVFSGSHGVSFPITDPAQAARQGAILTQDWAGPGNPVTPDSFFCADDLSADTDLAGLIYFFFACYGAGCPQFDTYSYDAASQPVRIANSTLVARLPQRLLLAGAQAVIGHIDRAWAYSFQTRVGTPMVQGLRDPMVRILQGSRVGDAMDVFDQRWTALSADLLNTMQNRKAFAQAVPDALLANKWVARDDARNYIVLGDPAARLRIDAIPS